MTTREEQEQILIDSETMNFCHSIGITDIGQQIALMRFMDTRANTRDRWVAIRSEEDLPKDEGQYWWTSRNSGRVCCNSYNKRIAADQYIGAYSAWIPITTPAPYTQEETKTNG